MKRYDSGYYVTDYAFYSPPPFKGKAFHISFEDMPDELEIRGKSYINGKYYPNKLVVIHAKSRHRAQYANDLIRASSCAIDGNLPLLGDRKTVETLDGDEKSNPEDLHSESLSIRSHSMSGGLPLACILAAKVSHRKAYQYALFKYLLSLELFSTNIMDLDPSHWRSAKFVFDSAEHHVHCAYSIVAAYSVLEDLGLEIRASTQSPSTIGGKWNPKVKAELEIRLTKAGIDISDTFLWTMRDTPTKIEKTKAPEIKTKADWTYLKVRDREVQLIDAIAYVSWIRSKISAHKLNDLSASLNYYEVANVQYLARRLLLERLGFLGDRYRVRLS